MKPVTPEPAATVILVREKQGSQEAGQGIEVFLTRRQDDLAFLGGYHVFPGGKLDKRDCAKDTIESCGELGKDPEGLMVPGGHPPDESIAYYVAAIRELFEEAGVILAYDADGKIITGHDEQLWKRLREARQKIHRREMCMTDMMKEEVLTYALDRLVWLSRWVTPATSPRRFDTQFFVARLPKGQKPAPYKEEISDSGWISPQDAINMWRERKIRIIPPTLASLDALVKYESWAQIKNDLGNMEKEGREYLF